MPCYRKNTRNILELLISFQRHWVSESLARMRFRHELPPACIKTDEQFNIKTGLISLLMTHNYSNSANEFVRLMFVCVQVLFFRCWSEKNKAYFSSTTRSAKWKGLPFVLWLDECSFQSFLWFILCIRKLPRNTKAFDFFLPFIL